MILPSAQDGTSYYRGAMPLALLARQHPELRLVRGMGDGTEWSWDRLAECDAVFIQRPHASVHLQVVMMARKLRLPVWVDYDDDLAAVPRSNPAYRVFSNPVTVSNIGECARLADVLTVSTPAIARRLGRDDVVVLPNGLNDFHVRPGHALRQKVISWRGSGIHQEDLLTVIGEIHALANEHPDWHWRFLGDPPWDIYHAIPAKQLTVGPEFNIQDPLAWLECFYEAAPFIHIVPLAPNRFNEAKSNCSWLEATAAGAMVIAPGFLTEFVRPGIRNYTTGQAFVEAVKAAMVEWRDGAMHPNVEISRKDIRRAGLLLSETNKVRWKIIKSLCRHPAPISQ